MGSKVIYFPDRLTMRARVAKEVRVAMVRADVNELQLAKEAGIAQSTLNRRLKPKNEADSFTVDELERVADVLGVTVGMLFAAAERDGDGGDDGGAAGAPTRARTWDLRIISPSNRSFLSVELDKAA